MNYKLSKLSALIRSLYRVIILICGFVALSPAQYRPPYDFYGSYDSGIYGIADKHFQGVLFPEVYKNMPSVKIHYPGLWVSDMNSAAFGLLPGHLSNTGWDGVYGWADMNSNPGIMGAWIGNFNVWNSYRVYDYLGTAYSWELNDFSLRGAFWATPFRNDVFKGASVTIDIDNSHSYNEFDGLTETMRVYININTLTKISEKYFLKAGFHTYSRHAEDPFDNLSDNRKVFKDGFYAGLIDEKMRTLEITAGNTFAMNNSEEKSDTVSASLRYTQGKAYSYTKHTLFWGLKAAVGVSYPSKIGDGANSFQYLYYLQNLTREGRIFHAAIIAPVTLDAHLFRGIRGMLSISPRIHYTHISPLSDVSRLPFATMAEKALYMNPQHTFVMGMPDIALSFRGGVGDKFDFTIVPTLNNDVFMAATEVRYRF